MHELEHKRTRFSKTFDLGNGQHRLEVGQLPCHFERDGRLYDIDLTPEFDGARGNHVIRHCPYSLRIDGDAPAYAYNSLNGKRVSVELVAAPISKPVVENGLFKWAEVGQDTDYIIQPLLTGCATLLVLNTPRASRKWSWRVQGDMDLIVPLVGKDSGGRRLELIERRDAESGTIDVEWTGRTLLPRGLRKARLAVWTDEVTWPVVIDPTVNENIAANADDVFSVWSANGANFSAFIAGNFSATAGRYSAYRFYAGVRFQTIAIPVVATIDSASLTVRVTGITGTPNLNIYGNDVDDAAVWANPGNRVKNITKTTAVTNKASWTNGADNAIDVASIVAEIIARGGWASNNDIAFGFFNNAGSGNHQLAFAALEHTTLSEARLSITYTAEETANADASSAGTATAIAAGAATADAAMNAAGLAAASAVGQAAVLVDAEMSASGVATPLAVGEAILAIDAAAFTAGAAVAMGVGAALADAVAESAGIAAAIAMGEGGLDLPAPPDFTPAGAGGAIYPPNYDKRFRLRKDKTRPHLIRFGEWPSEEELARIMEADAKAEQREFSQFIARLAPNEAADADDEEEKVLILLLSAV
jgi:hypothetical protein